MKQFFMNVLCVLVIIPPIDLFTSFRDSSIFTPSPSSVYFAIQLQRTMDALRPINVRHTVCQ